MRDEKSYKKYLLIVLATVLASNYLDRMTLGLLLQDIKRDLVLTDTQMGFLSGIAFALFYSVMAIPIARWADRGNRVLIVSVTTALWSGAVALCGIAANFFQLVLIRVGVAIGEAGCNPPAHSLIADHFDRTERPRAVGTYKLGYPVSVIIGFFLAGWLNELYGWRMTFVLLSLPGLPLALLAWLTLREPRLQKRATLAAATPAGAGPQPSVREVFLTLWAIPTFRHLVLFFSVMFFFGYGIVKWQPAFFIRSYGMQTGELGTWLAVVQGGAALIGIHYGGILATRYAANNERLQMQAMAITYACFAFLSAGIYLASNRYVAFALMALSQIGGQGIIGPVMATLQTLVPERMRAMSVAILYFLANLIGMGLGPVLVGVMSDSFNSWAGEESLRYALILLCPGYLWGAWHIWRASQTVTSDMEHAQRREALLQKVEWPPARQRAGAALTDRA